MAQSFNEVILMGRLVKDPEARAISNDKKVATFTLAVDGYKEGQTNFFDCEAWGQAGNYITSYLKKGSLILAQGELVQQTWEKDGKKFSKVVVRVGKVQSISTTKSSSEPMPQATLAGAREATDIDINSIPF